MNNSKFRWGRSLAVLSTLVALTGVAASAQAVSFRKTWDPIFSASFSALVGVNVGWRGEALVFVDDGCVSASTLVSFPDACGSASLQSYELEFYDFDTDAVLGTGSDSAPGTPLFPAVTAISFDVSEIANGIGLNGPILVDGPFTFGDYGTSFQAELFFDLDLNEEVNGPSLVLVPICEGEDCPSSLANDGETYPPVVTWSQVPVPTPLSLMGLGLLALGLMRRRIA